MLKGKERKLVLLTIVISAVLLVVLIAVSMVNNRPDEELAQEFNIKQTESVDMEHHHAQKSEVVVSTQKAVGTKKDIRDIIRAARTWGPGYTPWIGRKAPDFVLEDIDGKRHRLSGYKGKNVMLIFWATWCNPCLAEIPHLMELRSTVSENELVMMAISAESPRVVKDYARKRKINYLVASVNMRMMPVPFSMVNSIPSSFFIDSEGKIKLATIGLLSLKEIKAILQASPMN
ncbi:MAG: redoxin domain-containing protein [Sedimentisphaerales bacterium]|nr:redoxin domain-containing protein [Sedimentisphaerales bacterium]